MTSHMKKKAKRYQEGGEAEDKKRGLAASNKEGSVGFFERLRMGNIDDPKSEAYKRFGAGRGKAETAKTKASTIDQIGDRERMEAFTAGPLKSQAAAPMEDKKPAKADSNQPLSPKNNSRHLALTISVTILMIDVASSAVLKKTQKVKQLQVCHVKHGE
jgi:hypothetical protein